MSTEYVCTLSADLIKKAKEELNEDPKRRAQDIQILREWLLKQPHLKSRTDDEFLLRFLRVSKFSIERAKERIDRFYTMRTAIPEWFTKRDPLNPKFQELLNCGCYFFLPGYDKQGRKTMVLRIGQWNPQSVEVDYIFQLDQIISDLLMEDEQTQICGINRLTDVSNVVGAHLSGITFQIMRNQVILLQSVNPFRVGRLMFFNQPPIFQGIMSMIMFFLSEKLKGRLFSGGKNSLPSLKNMLPPEILPVEYGGTAGKMEDMIEDLKKELVMKRGQYLAEDETQYGVDESKRPGKPKTREDLFGVDGTFRKLTID